MYIFLYNESLNLSASPLGKIIWLQVLFTISLYAWELNFPMQVIHTKICPSINVSAKNMCEIDSKSLGSFTA